MKDNSPFPFHTIKEAWDYFTKASRIHFAKLIRQVASNSPEIRTKIRLLKNRDYCCRLLYILNIFAFEGDHEGEFDLDWAMLLAKPLSASQARKSLHDLIELGLMGTIELDDLDLDDDEPRRLYDGNQNRTPPSKNGGETSSGTKFDFDI